MSKQPELLPHIHLRAGDLMQTEFPAMNAGDPIREAGLAIDHTDYDLVPVIDDDGVLIGIITTRALARRYVRESRASSTLREATYLQAVVDVLDGELLAGEDRPLTGRVWVHASSLESDIGIGASDIVVVGDRADAQRRILERGIALLVLSNGAGADEQVLELARQHGHRGGRLAARHLRIGANDHARRPLPRADGERPDRGQPPTI